MAQDAQPTPQAAPRPGAQQQPAWRQGFDAVERQVAPALESALRSEQFAVAVGLAARVQRALQQQASRSTRRVLHQLNLPAGTDVSRILNELGRLQRQVRELTHQLDEAQASIAMATAALPAAADARANAATRRSTSRGSAATTSSGTAADTAGATTPGPRPAAKRAGTKKAAASRTPAPKAASSSGSRAGGKEGNRGSSARSQRSGGTRPAGR